MRKKAISALLIFALLCSALVLSVTADDQLEPEVPILPDDPYVDISYFNICCSINSSGLATCSSFAQTAHDSYTIYLALALYRYSNGQWHRIAGPWYNSRPAGVSVYKQYWVTPGYYYCTGATATVFDSDGNYVESQDLFSQIEYY